MDQNNNSNNSDDQRTDEEFRVLLERAKKLEGKPKQKQRHGANTWRHWLEEDEDE